MAARVEVELWSEELGWVESAKSEASVVAPPPANAAVTPRFEEAFEEAVSDVPGPSFGWFLSSCLVVALAVPQLAWLTVVGRWVHGFVVAAF